MPATPWEFLRFWIVGGALLVSRLSFLGKARTYLAQLGFSFSFFLLLVPGIGRNVDSPARRTSVGHRPCLPGSAWCSGGVVRIFVLGHFAVIVDAFRTQNLDRQPRDSPTLATGPAIWVVRPHLIARSNS